jgi:alkyl sulfatase BDS1-like metallo-beta-lactamase superfamily hydrolase
LVGIQGAPAGTSFAGEETDATKRLKARSAEFDRAVIRVTEGVYTAVGYGTSTVSMVIGDESIVIIDAGHQEDWSR